MHPVCDILTTYLWLLSADWRRLQKLQTEDEDIKRGDHRVCLDQCMIQHDSAGTRHAGGPLVTLTSWSIEPHHVCVVKLWSGGFSRSNRETKQRHNTAESISSLLDESAWAGCHVSSKITTLAPRQSPSRGTKTSLNDGTRCCVGQMENLFWLSGNVSNFLAGGLKRNRLLTRCHQNISGLNQLVFYLYEQINWAIRQQSHNPQKSHELSSYNT